MAEHTEEAIKWGWMMFFWGILLIAIGVGSILDLNIWPIILIAVGASMVSRVLFGSKNKRGWSSWSCWVGPSFKERDQDEGHRQTTD
jgi:uncharacterized membrane protein